MSRELAAVHVPRHIDDDKIPRYVRRALNDDGDSTLDGLCLAQKPTGTGRWVCVRPTHDGDC